mgnify:CR=1 FL=1
MSASTATSPSPTADRQTLIGVGLSLTIIMAWATVHVWGVHFFRIGTDNWFWVPPLILLQMWLSVGLFIIAHDAIHGSLAPGRRWLNDAFGWVTLTLYAGFNYRRFAAAHHAHHKAPGTKYDPDFSVTAPTAFLPWYKEFMGRHFSWRPLIFVNVVVGIYWLVLGASMVNIFLFYGLPAIASSAQLFYFGTFRPHRHGADGPAFADDHHANTNEFGFWASLFSCYHFGYHHEHHLYPYEPWWRLPARRLYGRSPS